MIILIEFVTNNPVLSVALSALLMGAIHALLGRLKIWNETRARTDADSRRLHNDDELKFRELITQQNAKYEREIAELRATMTRINSDLATCNANSAVSDAREAALRDALLRATNELEAEKQARVAALNEAHQARMALDAKLDENNELLERIRVADARVAAFQGKSDGQTEVLMRQLKSANAYIDVLTDLMKAKKIRVPDRMDITGTEI